MAKNRYITHFVNFLTAEQTALRSLSFAINRYLVTRKSWLENSSPTSSYSWRGGWKNGRLFFNRKTTTKNIELMQEAVFFIENNSHTFVNKVKHLEMTWGQLSSGGRGRELLSAFFSMVNDQALVIIPKRYCSKKPLLIVDGETFTYDKRIGKGGGGVAARYIGKRGRAMVVKNIYKRNKSTFTDLTNEAEFCQYAYETLGPDFIPDFRPVADLPSGFFDQRINNGQHLMVQPFIRGMTFKKYALACKDAGVAYNETAIFGGCFDFLFKI